jgi:hypothetical protein
MLISSASVGAALRSGCRRAASSVKPVRRAHTSHALRSPASETAIGRVSLPQLTRSLRRRPAESLRGALGPCGFGFRKVRLGSTCIGIHRRLTIRSSRPHVVASAACFALRLHASAAPPRGGLTQALGGKEHSAVALSALQLYQLRSALLFGLFVGTSLLRSSSSDALTLRMRCVGRLRERRSSSAGLPRLTRGFGHDQL